MHISGDNWNFCREPSPFSYFFSWYCYSCGWATWRRAFQHYDPEIKLWPELRETSWMLDILGDAEAVEFWTYCFDRLYAEGIERCGGTGHGYSRAGSIAGFQSCQGRIS